MFLTVKHTEREAAVRVVSGVLIMACMLLSSYLFEEQSYIFPPLVLL